MDITKLRMMGYSADEMGIICHRGEVRFAHERTGLLKIEISRDSKDARAVVDAVISAIDEPRALLGRDRRGGVVLFFRVETGVNNSLSDLALRSGEEIVITFGSEGQALNPDSYTWQKNRSPYDVPRDSLPPLHSDHWQDAERAAWTAGARLPEEIARERATEERIAQFKADLAAGRVKLKTPEELQAAKDEEIVEANKDRDLASSDGWGSQMILAARGRLAAWRAKQKQAETDGAA